VSKDRTKIALQMDLQLEKHGNVQSLMQYINKENLLEQHKNQKGNKATGVDKVTKAEYEKDIYNNIDKLLKEMKKFGYKPQPVRRTYIPKTGSDKLRQLGIPAYEDKLVQGVMADILNAIYENKFCKTSYGFRPDRDCHMAIKELDNLIMKKKVNYIVDADIKGFFDNVDQEWLIKFL
jgi:retron-type reverse transcriptase